MSNTQSWTRVAGSERYNFNIAKFLDDFPIYTKHFRTHQFESLNSIVLTNEVTTRIKPLFDVSISFHEPDRIWKDLHQLKREGLPSKNAACPLGYMSPLFRGANEFYIALAAIERKKLTLISTVVHELGHYAEERVRFDRKLLKSTSMQLAIKYLHLRKTGAGKSNSGDLHYLADEWVAWINSIWVATVLDVEIEHSVLGMIGDETGWPDQRQTITSTLDLLVNFVHGQVGLREKLLSTNDSKRCAMIDATTSCFLRILLQML